MIERYTGEQMGEVWSEKSKFESMKQVEVAVAKAQASLGLIPRKSAKDIEDKSSFNVQKIKKLEESTRHDVVAFVSNLADSVGQSGKYIHYGLTSSDVLDTSMSLRVRWADKVLSKSLKKFEQALRKQITKHEKTLCAGRTHGMHAEPTSLGLKFAGFLAEFLRNKNRYERAVQQMLIGKLSGAVGAYSSQKSFEVEKKVCKSLKLEAEVVATQVVPRDRYAELTQALAFLGCGIERLAVELRHLQRTEVNEVLEGFSKGQKGSSAMPHKKNPISAENLTGISRMLKAYAQTSLENISLWHERDISHSAVERVFFADAFILCDYAFERMAQVVSNLHVNKVQMLKNMELSQGQLFSSRVLSTLVEKGLDRENAYKIIQSCSHSLTKNSHLKQKLKSHKQVLKYLKTSEIDKIFNEKSYQKDISQAIKRVLR